MEQKDSLNTQGLNNEEEDLITLIFDGKEVVCNIIACFPVDDQDYIALLPTTPIEDAAEDELLLYRYSIVDDEVVLDVIQDDEEFELVADAFDELLDEEAFNEMDS